VKKLSDIGERQIIKKISEIITPGNEIIGIGDDCAVLELDSENYFLITTDMINKKTHILDKMTPFQIGWFSVAINLSDIASMGGKPLGVVLSLGLPDSLNIDFVEELMKGADKCATIYKTSIVGGDTKKNPSITISGTAFGRVEKVKILRRKGAKPGDVIAVTGNLGKSAAGWLSYKKKNYDDRILSGLFEPIPRVLEGIKLSDEKIVSCCMDVSDGLSSSLYQLKEVNNLGFEIYKDKLPISKKLVDIIDSDIDIFDYILHYGGDYELLFTLSEKNVDRARAVLEGIECNMSVIGRVTKNDNIVFFDGKSRNILENRGFEHFKGNIC